MRRQDSSSEYSFPTNQSKGLIKNPHNFKIPTGGPPYSRASAVRNALLKYHSLGSEAKTILYLQDAFKRQAWNDVHLFIPQIHDYIQSYESRDLYILKTRHRYRFKFDSAILGQPIVLFGEIARLDMTKTGHSVTQIGSSFENWDEDPMFPILQYIYSTSNRMPMTDVSIGVYDTRRGRHEEAIFSSQDIENALTKLDQSLAIFFAERS